MKVRSDRRHSFHVSPEDLWAAMARVDDYRRWWPWLRRFDAPALQRGATWRATVQPPLPYRVSFELHLAHVDAPHVVAADITGDIEGEARLELTPTALGCELHLRSVLEPARPLLRGIGFVAGPMARFGHEWVLGTGLRQFSERALA